MATTNGVNPWTKFCTTDWNSPTHLNDFLPRVGMMDLFERQLKSRKNVDPAVAKNARGYSKTRPEEFCVAERTPRDYPGCVPEAVYNKLLTVSYDSDLPGLIIDPDMVDKKGVRFTLIKRGLNSIHAVNKLAQYLSICLGRHVSPEDITLSGIKDRWAITLQRAHLNGVSYNEFNRLQLPKPSRANDPWMRVKDAHPSQDGELSRGQHGENHFVIVIRLPGWSKSQIDAYMAPRLQLLDECEWRIINPFGRQRLGKRQNLDLVGHTLLTGDYSPERCDYPFNSNTEAATHRFLLEITGREHPGAEQLRRDLASKWLYFDDMAHHLAPRYELANLGFEHKLAERLADYDRYQGDFQRVVYSMYDDTNLWVGSWIAFWWNQALMVLLSQMETVDRRDFNDYCSQVLDTGYTSRSMKIPFLMATPEAEAFYQTLGFEQALSELGQADNFVTESFLTPRPRKTETIRHNRRKYDGPSGPWRHAFTPVTNFEGRAEDGAYHCSFTLRNGAYATVFLGLLFDLDEQQVADDISDVIAK